MLRPGRLDKLLYVDLPTTERKEILIKASRELPLEGSISLENIAYDQKCDNFSGADITKLVQEAAMASIKRRIYSIINMEDGKFLTIIHDKKREQPLVTQSDFDEAFKKVKPSVAYKEKLKYLKINKRMEINT